MLVIRNLDVIFDPYNSRRRVGLNMTLEVHVVLKSLSKSGSRDGDNRCEFYFNSYVSPGSFAYSIFSDTIVGTTIFFAD